MEHDRRAAGGAVVARAGAGRAVGAELLRQGGDVLVEEMREKMGSRLARPLEGARASPPAAVTQSGSSRWTGDG